jgi:starvation-inducible DNA-binding protein
MRAQTARDKLKGEAMTQFTIPGLTEKQGIKIAELLQKQLSTYNDLHLTLKHVHWNVVGPNFIGAHEMIDPQVELVRGYADEVAERIATLGGSPQGTPGAILKDRTWDDYSVGRDVVQAHLAALDLVYNGVVQDTRKAIAETDDLDPVTQDILIDHSAELEKFQWFVRAHLENAGGQLAHAGSSTERSAAKTARRKS